MDSDNIIPWVYSNKQKGYTNGYGNHKYSQNGGGNYNNKRSTRNNNSNNNNHNNNHHHNHNNNNNNQYQYPKHIEFNLSSISIEEYHESVDYSDDYKLRFRYKYLEEGISIFLNDNRCKIYIPVDNIEAISKIQSNAIVLTLKRDKDSPNSVHYNSKEGYIRNDPIRENLFRATSISMIAQESTPQQVIDMAGLHIHYLINRNNKNRAKIPSYNWEKSNLIPCLLMKEEELLLKCHIGQDIRILNFIQPIRYEEIKRKIQEAFEVAEISKLKYKDEDGEFITIINNIDFNTAAKLYKKENKLEIWIIE